MKIRKLFSRVFKAGTNPNDCPWPGRNAGTRHQGGPLTDIRNFEYRSFEYLRDLELINRRF